MESTLTRMSSFVINLCLAIIASKISFIDCNNTNFGGDCRRDSLAVYKIELQGHWTEELFPKHFPKFRPPAHFSKSFGLSHAENFFLYDMNEIATPGLGNFCLTGNTEMIDSETTDEKIFDKFALPKLSNPIEKTESLAFVSSNSSFISVITKLVPSPDWFIGQRLHLCRESRWVEKISLEVRPIDCGVNSGLTFSAPLFKNNPPEKLQIITPQNPNHKASSFYYEDKNNLPPIAYYKLQKVKEYVGVKEKSVKRIHQKFRRHQNDQNLKRSGSRIHHIPQNSLLKTTNVTDNDYESPDCIVSKWNEWSECSITCGLGEKFRNRTIIKLGKKGGQPCPNLSERRWCGSSRCESSNSHYFRRWV